MIKERAYAKINLVLDVVSKRKDNYHNLKMIMIPVNLYDSLEFELSDKDLITSDVKIENNSMYKAIELIKKKYSVQSGVKIILKKKIPIGAGLGGGSADIAATIRGLNRLWGLNIKQEDLEKIALDLGSDTLFCLYNKPAYVQGRGEHLLFVNNPPIKNIFIVVSTLKVLTKTIFESHEIKHKKRRFDKLFREYLNEKYEKFFNKSYNDLTKTTLTCYPELKKTYKIMKNMKNHFLMSGSGATFYALSFKGGICDIEEKLVKKGLSYIKTTPKE